MWPIISSALSSISALISNAIPYLLSATMGALLSQPSPEPQQKYRGDFGVQIEGGVTINYVDQERFPLDPLEKRSPSTLNLTKPSLAIAMTIAVYGYCRLAVKRGEALINNHNAWMHRINQNPISRSKSRSIHEQNNGDKIQTLIETLEEIENEYKTLSRYLSVYSILSKMQTISLFTKETWHQNQAEKGLQRLDLLKASIMDSVFQIEE